MLARTHTRTSFSSDSDDEETPIFDESSAAETSGFGNGIECSGIETGDKWISLIFPWISIFRRKGNDQAERKLPAEGKKREEEKEDHTLSGIKCVCTTRISSQTIAPR
jgi:hypothetical protein